MKAPIYDRTASDAAKGISWTSDPSVRGDIERGSPRPMDGWVTRLGKDGRDAAERFITFTAGEAIDVYIAKSPESTAELVGYSLVEEGVSIEDDVYYPAGVDVYMRSYRRGEEVVIPGAASSGIGNLYFVQEGRTPELRITEPRVSEALYSGDVVELVGDAMGRPEAELAWSLLLDGGEWQELGTGTRLTVTLPTVDESTGAILRVEGTEAGRLIGRDEQRVTIRNEVAMRWLYPGPGDQVPVGEAIELLYEARGHDGGPARDVALFVSDDGETWRGIDGPVGAPETAGTIYLASEIGIPGGRVHRQTVAFDVVEAYHSVTILAGEKEHDLSPLVFTEGEGYGPRESGRVYGFDGDHRDRYREESPWAVVPRVRLRSGETFQVATGNGRYRVDVLLSGVTIKHGYVVRVNGRASRSIRTRARAVIVTMDVWVSDGRLVIDGEGVLPIAGVRYLRVDEGEAEIETRIERVWPWEGREALSQMVVQERAE